jgi:hypothetical protein
MDSRGYPVDVTEEPEEMEITEEIISAAEVLWMTPPFEIS